MLRGVVAVLLMAGLCSAAYNDTGVRLEQNGSVIDIWNVGSFEGKSPDGFVHYYLNSSQLDREGNYIMNGSPFFFYDVLYGFGNQTAGTGGIELANLTASYLYNWQNFTESNFTNWNNYSVVQAQMNASFGLTYAITRKLELNATQGKINETLSVVPSRVVIQNDLYAIYRLRNFKIGNVSIMVSTKCYPDGSGCNPITIPVDGRKTILSSGDIEPYAIINGSNGMSAGYEFDNSTFANDGFWVELQPNEIDFIFDMGKPRPSSPLLVRDYWVDATCNIVCSPSCDFSYPIIYNGSNVVDGYMSYPTGTSRVVKIGPTITKCATGSCSAASGCSGQLYERNSSTDPGKEVISEATGGLYETCGNGLDSCENGTWYARTGSLSLYTSNFTLYGAGNTTGTDIGGYWIFGHFDAWLLGGQTTDSILVTITDSTPPNVTYISPPNNTVFTTPTFPYQINLQCNDSDAGYVNAYNKGNINVSVYNYTSGALLNSTFIYPKNFTHQWLGNISFNESYNGSYNWSCTAIDEAQNVNQSMGNFTLSLNWLIGHVTSFIQNSDAEDDDDTPQPYNPPIIAIGGALALCFVGLGVYATRNQAS